MTLVLGLLGALLVGLGAALLAGALLDGPDGAAGEAVAPAAGRARAAAPPAWLARRLAEAGLAGTPARQLLVAAAGAAAIGALLGHWAAGSALAAGLGALAGPWALWRWLAWREGRRRAERREALIGAIATVQRAVTVDRTVQEAIELLVTDGPEPLRPAFGWAAQAVMRNSMGYPAALRALRRQFADPLADDFLDLLALAIERTPAGLARGLAGLADEALADADIRREAAAEQVGARAGAGLVAGGAAALYVALRWLNPDYMRAFDDGPGQVVLAACAVMMIAVAWLMSRIGALPEEARLPAAESEREG